MRPRKKKVIAYIDGFNLYHAICETQKDFLKWVNLDSLIKSTIRDNEELIAVKYFSAYAHHRPETVKHHKKYVEFLEHYGVTCIMGNFQKKTVYCQNCQTNFVKYEEKETDVNIGLHVLEDGLHHSYDRAIIVSADSDLVPVVEKAKSLKGKEIFILIPKRKKSKAYHLQKIASGYTFLDEQRIRGNLLPKKITLQSGKMLTMPIEYESKKNKIN